MIDAPTITQASAQPTAVVHLTIPKDAIQREMGPAREEVMRTLAEQGATPSGPWFSRHFRMDPAVWDFEVGVPVAAPIAATGRVVELARCPPAAWRARTTAVATRDSVPDGASSTPGSATRDCGTEGSLWESYAAGPESGAEPAGWRTELSRPLR